MYRNVREEWIKYILQKWKCFCFILLFHLIIRLALIKAVFHVGDHFWTRQNQRQKNLKTFFFQDKFYSLEVYAHYFIVLKYLTTWRAAKLGICALFTSINVLQCSQSINPLMYVYDTDPHAFYESLMLVMVTLKSSWVQNHQWVVLRSTQSSFFLGWWTEYQVLLGTQM